MFLKKYIVAFIGEIKKWLFMRSIKQEHGADIRNTMIDTIHEYNRERWPDDDEEPYKESMVKREIDQMRK